MPRYKLVNGERIQLTAEEEAQRDQEEADWNAGAFDRAIADLRQRRNALLSATDFYAGHTEADATGGPSFDSGLAQSTSDAFATVGTIGSGNDESCSGFLHLFNPSSTTFVKHFISSVTIYGSTPQSQVTHGAGYCNTTSAVDAVRFNMESGNIDAGDICLYGIN